MKRRLGRVVCKLFARVGGLQGEAKGTATLQQYVCGGAGASAAAENAAIPSQVVVACAGDDLDQIQRRIWGEGRGRGYLVDELTFRRPPTCGQIVAGHRFEAGAEAICIGHLVVDVIETGRVKVVGQSARQSDVIERRIHETQTRRCPISLVHQCHEAGPKRRRYACAYSFFWAPYEQFGIGGEYGNIWVVAPLGRAAIGRHAYPDLVVRNDNSLAAAKIVRPAKAIAVLVISVHNTAA